MFGSRKDRAADTAAEILSGMVQKAHENTIRVDPVTGLALDLLKLTYGEFVGFADELGEFLKDTQKPVDVALHEWAKARVAKLKADKAPTWEAVVDAPTPAPAPAPAPVSAAALAAADHGTVDQPD